MIKHVVCFKIKDEYKNKIAEAKEKMLMMKDNVKTVVSINVGIDFLHSARSFDLILEVMLNNKSDLDLYQNDPFHCNVVKTLMHQIAEKSIALDFEVE